MHAAGFGHVDWTDGNTSANAYQKVIMAIVSGDQGPRLSKSSAPTKVTGVDDGARTTEAERLVQQYASGWATPQLLRFKAKMQDNDRAPNRIVQKLAENPSVAQVVCVNRESISVSALKQQQDAFQERNIMLKPAARAKLRVLATDTAKP
ncbi:hypothetical protein BDV23DRAFT_184835 [Aspergillus alliaceus]|uniref:Uncharacterized protein n=1 Tax=Petromyces alliaceus TaxID=209559 RepID=A0A5N7C4E8_PETAA|nr:hypothetical protein BDV23DRAFT_184835 [Aspergillus alliaceus]